MKKIWRFVEKIQFNTNKHNFLFMYLSNNFVLDKNKKAWKKKI